MTYTCDHCSKLYVRKEACAEHEKKCRKNPDNYQICLDGCDHLVKKDFTVTPNHHFGGEGTETRECLFCTKKKEGVVPYWVNPDYVYEELCGNESQDIYGNNYMPKECDSFCDQYVLSSMFPPDF